jgi:hypothetical protein
MADETSEKSNFRCCRQIEKNRALKTIAKRLSPPVAKKPEAKVHLTKASAKAKPPAKARRNTISGGFFPTVSEARLQVLFKALRSFGFESCPEVSDCPNTKKKDGYKWKITLLTDRSEVNIALDQHQVSLCCYRCSTLGQAPGLTHKH